jgi:hypothetical protein
MADLPPPSLVTVRASDLGNILDDAVSFRAAELSKLAELGIEMSDLASDSPPILAVVWAAWLHARRTSAPGLSWDAAQESIEIVFDGD